jgi:hypothetical protein
MGKTKKENKKEKLVCPNCGHKYEGEVSYLKQSKCPSCFSIFYTDAEKVQNFSYHRYKDAQAFGIDTKTGRPVGIDSKGKRFDPKESRYDFKRDPHGWKAIYGRKAKITR